MRAYFAIMKDSFREAFASRVLWILLALTTLLLITLAPIGLSEQPATLLRHQSLLDLSGLISKIQTEATADELSPGKLIWNRFGGELKARLEKQEGEPAGKPSADMASDVLAVLNSLLSDRAFYDPSAWRGIELNEEATALANRSADSLSQDEVKRRNRLLLEAAYPEIARGKPELSISYLVWPLSDSLPLSRKEAVPAIKGIVAGIISFFVGTLGVLAAILVTSPIIPQTFEPGAIDLLLSKPVSRSLLFLAKFLGGCAFILLNAAYFIVGLWLIIGLRFDVWSGRLLACIPVFLFLFAIYYSVSALAGVLWRNAVVSILVTILFWTACFAVGTTKNVMEQVWINPARLVKLIAAGDSLFGVTDQGVVQQWRATEQKWEETFQAEGPPPPKAGPFVVPQRWTGPIYDPAGDRLLAVQTPPAATGFSFFPPVPTLWVAPRNGSWIRRKGPVPAAGTSDVFVDGQGEIIAVGTRGVSRLSRLEANDAAAEKTAESFVAAGPVPSVSLQSPLAAALNVETGEIALRSRNTVTILERNPEDKYTKKRDVEITGDAGAVLAFGGSTLVVGLSDGRVLHLDAATLMVQQEFRPAGGIPPRFAAAAPNGRWFLVLFHNHQLWLFDAEERKAVSLSIRGQGDISAAIFSGPDRLLVADRGNRVTSYQLSPFQTEDRRAPPLTLLERVYHYVIVPIYTVFPKPGELDNVVSYLLTDQETVAATPNHDDLSQRRIKIDVYGPIWSSLTFLVVVLAFTCFYIRRTDF
ncbi:MAG TPA: ABC transporter permease [Planctomycetaceae bacterium]|nr:ABC transporter permease [Planctomycetaceae bacterium]